MQRKSHDQDLMVFKNSGFHDEMTILSIMSHHVIVLFGKLFAAVHKKSSPIEAPIIYGTKK